MVKNPPAMQETPVQFLDWEDPVEEGMATHFSILAWRISWTEKTGGLQPKGFGLQKSQTLLKQLEHTTHRALLLGPHS